MKTTKLFAVILAMLLSVTAFTGCSGNGDASSSTDSSQTSSMTDEGMNAMESGSSDTESTAASAASGSASGDSGKTPATNNSNPGTNTTTPPTTSLPGTGEVIQGSKFEKLNLTMKKLDSGLSVPTEQSLKLTNKKVKLMQPAGGGDWAPGGMYYEGLKRIYGLEIELVPVVSGTEGEKLAQAINSNDAPDLFFSQLGFPVYPVSGLAQPVDNALDYSIDILKHCKSFYDAYQYKGQHFSLYYQNVAETAVFYNKQIFEDNDMKTPLQLYNENKWDWDAMADAARDLTVIDKQTQRVSRYGMFYVNWQSSQLVFTTGVNYITESNGVFKNNLNNSAYARAFKLLTDLVNDKYVATNRDIAATNTNFDNGKAAMIIAPNWAGTNVNWFSKLKQSQNLEYVPLPKDPQSKEYIVPGMASGFYVPIGAKNLPGVRAVMYGAAAIFQESVSIGSDSYNDFKEKNQAAMPGITDEYFEYLATQYKKNNEMTFFVDAYRNNAYEMDAIYNLMIGAGGEKPMTFDQAVNSLSPAINTSISEWNKK